MEINSWKFAYNPGSIHNSGIQAPSALLKPAARQSPADTTAIAGMQLSRGLEGVELRRNEPLLVQVKSGAEQAANAAAAHRESGLGLNQGLVQFRRDLQGAAFLDVLNHVLAPQMKSASASSAPADPPDAFGAVLAQAGTAGQAYMLEQGRYAAAQYAASELGLPLPANASWGDMAEALWGQLTSVPAAGGAAMGGTSAAGPAMGGQSGAASGAGAGTAEGAAAGAGGTAGLSTAGQILGGIGAAYSAYQLIDNFGQSSPQAGAVQGATIGAYIGSWFSPVGTAIGTVIGGIAGAVAGLFHGGKHIDQQRRDAVRDFLQETGLLNGDNELQLADGSLYGIGRDGGFKLPSLDGTERRAYECDFSNPFTHEAIGWAQPLAALLTGGDPKLRSDFTGYFVNAAQSNAQDLEGVRQNIVAMFERSGISPEQAVNGLAQMRRAGTLPDAEYAAFANGLQTLLCGTTSTGELTRAQELRRAA